MPRFIVIPLAVLALLAPERAAHACGCFAQPNPVERVVQAGERIIFAARGPEIEMHVQVNYSGDANSFGWLLPVPEEPELDVGSDRLFTALEGATQRRYFVDFQFPDGCGFRGNGSDTGNGGNGGDSGAVDAGAGAPSPVVSRQDVGAFDAVVLRADDATAMFDWLNDNEFIVPVGPEDDVVQRYLGAGRFFVALKLQANRSTGDIQPIVLTFDAPAAMIPITLTQVGAIPDLPVITYVFGEHRAIPRNYRHTELNEAKIDWFRGGSNYVDVVTRAVDEAEGAHSFVTEYAGEPPPVFFDGDGSFPLDQIRTAANAADLVNFIIGAGFPQDAKIANLLRQFVPYPAEAAAQGITEDDFYGLIFFYLGPRGQFDGRALPVDGGAVADALEAEVVEPAQRAQALIDDFPKLTRLFTTISPEEMTVDPAFDFSPLLPDVDRLRRAQFRPVCDPEGGVSSEGWLTLPDGRNFYTTPSGWRDRIAANPAPFSRRIQALYAEAEPEDLVDNRDVLTPSDPPSAAGRVAGDSGCRTAPGPWVLPLALLFGVLALARRRRAR